MIGSFVFGVMFALGCVALVRRAPKIERALVEAGPDPDRVLDLMTWNDLEHTYALHDGRSRRVVGPYFLHDDPAARRIARWNQVGLERLDTSELMGLLAAARHGVEAWGP